MATQAAGAKLELQLHPGDEYVGSWEPESLQVLSYVKLSKASAALSINASCISYHTSSAVGHCPVLQRGAKKVALGSEEIVTYLKEQGFNIDGHLKDYQQAEVVAYAALLKDRILPAILYSRWLDSQNYVEVTRHWYSQFLYFPLSLVFLSWGHRAVQHRLMTPAPSMCTEEQRGIELLTKAEECINLLSARLGADSYFSGGRPSSLDALIFGYLEVLLQCPLPSNNSLHRTVHSCVNLKNFCDRIRGSCFPDKKQRSAVSNSSTVRKSVPTTLWKDPMLWAWVGVAAFLLGVQGVRVGLFSRVGAWVASHRHSQEEAYEEF